MAPTRTLYAGERLAHVGVMVACEPGAGPLKGLRVRVGGAAVRSGTVEVSRARARPWSARLAPWETAGWEHALEAEASGDSRTCALRGARVCAVPRVGMEASASADRRTRSGLGHAVWVEIEGCARAEGEGVLELSVEPLDGGSAVLESIHVRVRAVRPREVLSAYLAFGGPLVNDARKVRDALDRFALLVSTLLRGERVMVARAAAPDRLYLRPGCVVFGAHGLVGDDRFRRLVRRMSAGSIEQLVLAQPGRGGARDEALEAVMAHNARYAPGPVELHLSVGRALVDDGDRARVAATLADIVRDSGAFYGFVAEHDWVPAFLEATPWERASGREPARTEKALREFGRVDRESALFEVR